jgi:DNA-binding NarL/FixJ family response regulator
MGAIAHVRRLSTRKTVTLTRREREIADLLRRGLSNRSIATELVISERTVENHLASIFAKSGVHSRAEFISSTLS